MVVQYFRFLCSFWFIFFVSPVLIGQVTVKFRGKFLDAETRLPVENVSLRVGELYRQVSDRKGDFTLSLPAGQHRVLVRHMSYEEQFFTINLQRDTVVTFILFPLVHLLEESVVKGEREAQGLGGLAGGRFELDMQQLRALPKFIGNNDPLKILQLLPGVQTSGEGNSGIFVRGGEPGHNMILWDGAPVYNASHLLGAFSVFNTGHIGKFTLYKSHMPADYGGRLSSLIEVQSPDLIPGKLSVSGDIGLIASQATIAVPLGEKSAFYVSGRQTYVGLTIKPLLGAMTTGRGKDLPFNYEFGDCNFTYVYRPDPRNKLVVNTYWGTDHLKVEDKDYQLDGKLKWWNLAMSASWEHHWNKKGKSRNTLFYSQYRNRLDVTQNGLQAGLPSEIRDWGYRHKTTFTWGKVDFSAGGDYVFHHLEPQSPNVGMNQEDWGTSAVQTYYTHEAALFANGNVHLTSWWTVGLGLRYALSFQTGPFDDLSYDNRGMLVDSVHYGRGRVPGLHGGWEPRISMQYRLGATRQLQFSYNRQRQWVNLVSISGVGLPTDFWVPASRNIPAQWSDQFAGGYFQSLWGDQYEISIEGYYRKLHQQMEYKSALFDLFNQQYILEQSINYGSGRAYGMELIVKKNRGRLSGWVSYTLGWSERNFPAIMNGAIFPAKHDRRHDLSLVTSYKLNQKWDISGVFVYATGSCYTMPTGMYMMGGNLVKEYGAYNGSRLPAYHRVDLSATYWFFRNKERESGLNFSVYNIYKRSNPMYIFILAQPSRHTDNQIIIRTKRKRLYDIIPSVSWTFRF